MEQCLHAEELGLNSVWVPEHHFGLFGVLPSAPVFLANVAARTKRVKLGPATVLLPVQHPLRVAEEFALLDLLSNGRAQLSVGRGYDAREYAAFGVDFTESQEIFFEGLEVIKKAWSQETSSHQGVHYQFPEITVLPRCSNHTRRSTWRVSAKLPCATPPGPGSMSYSRPSPPP